jgi:hypothetical protein
LGDTGPATTGLDQHLDRSLDIDFSGEVFLRHCRAPLLDLVRPLFDREPLERQPAIVVDTGCGDGSLLQTLYLAIAAETARGRGLERYPLLMVGADISPVAQQSTERKLAAANIPHVVLDGDIGAPERLAEALAAQGLDMKNALHVSKSVIHNRIYRAPRDEAAAGCRAPCSDGVFIAPEGGLIAPVDMEQNLCEHFRSWAPWTERHGMVVIEAHTVAPEQAAAHVGESVLTMLSASHGYSRQYLIEAHCHRALAREGGFVTLGQRDLITHPSGEALMTLDYLKPKHAVGLADLFL